MSRKAAPLAITAVTSSLMASGCAGPTTPLGAIWAVKPSQVKSIAEDQARSQARAQARGRASRSPASVVQAVPAEGAPSLRFSPSRQVLHGPRAVTVVVDDPAGIQDGYKLKVQYNGVDVTTSFMLQAKRSMKNNGYRLALTVPQVRLSASQEHDIVMTYESALGSVAESGYETPKCRAFEYKTVLTTEGFSPSPMLLERIEQEARVVGFNPALATGLIAQESGFNPRTVSRSRAIGLTQVTPIAEVEVSELYAGWPRYPGINDMSAALVRMMVDAGQINERNEWRLNEETSVRGGLVYAETLAQRWSSPEKWIRIRSTFTDPDVELTKLVLASYNSGFTRVAAAFDRLGPEWLSAPELREARKYVGRILSFCDHFSDPEVSHENET